MNRSRRHPAALAAALFAIAAAPACSDPAGPPIAPESFELQVRNWFSDDPIKEEHLEMVELQVTLANDIGAAESDRAARLRELIDSMAVAFPLGLPIVALPVEFEPRGNGRLGTLIRRTREGGLSKGSYTLTVGFSGGEIVRTGTRYDGVVLNRAFIQSVDDYGTFARIRWSVPTPLVAHDWTLTLERVDEGNETVFGSLSGSAAGPGNFGSGSQTFTVGIDYERDPDGLYAFVLVMTAAQNYRRQVIPF